MHDWNDDERGAVASLTPQADAGIRSAQGGSWDERKQSAGELLAAVNRAWWGVHSKDLTAFQRDLARLNKLADWRNQHEQVAFWKRNGGPSLLMPPKFFGGDPLALDENFVASVSLNHAVPTARDLTRELKDQQNELDCFEAHRQYFRKAYGYSRFFQPRGKVLHAYATAIGAVDVPPADDWAAINDRFALYLEVFPTRSVKFGAAPSCADLNERVFVCALNSIAHDVVLRLLQPRRILLAGKATWNAWPDSGLSARGHDVGSSVRKSSVSKCPVYRNDSPSSIYGTTVRIVRTNFLRTVSGPNSTDELERLGRDVLGLQ